MEEIQQPKAVDRKKRVQRLKKMILLGLVIGITVPWILCVILFVMVMGLNREKQEWDDRFGEMTALMQQQDGRFEEQSAALLEQLSAERTQREQLERRLAELQVKAEETTTEPVTEIPSSEAKHKVYLTFDDGPSVHTNEILDILKEYDVKATFFVLGKDSDGAVLALKRIVEEGHSLGMHSYSHQYDDIYASKETFAADFEKIREYLFQVTGVTSKIYRFPGGSSNTVTNTDIHDFIDYLTEQNTVYFDWNIASGDAAKMSLSVDTIVANATNGIETRPVSVILFHDAAGRETTVEALPIVIEKILAMEDTEILPITEDTEPVQHVKAR